MQVLKLQLAQELVELALRKAAADFGRPICIAICDAQGFLMAFGRLEGAPVRSIAISQGKAYSAARMGVTTEAFLERIHRERIDVAYFCDPGLTALPGGAPLKAKDGTLLGAAGISGLAASEDQIIVDALAAHVAAA